MKKILVLILAACGASSNVPPKQSEKAPIGASDSCVCVAMGVDYTNKVGTTNVVGLPSGTVGSSDLLHGSASGDSTVRALGDKVFILNRFGFDNVTELARSGDKWTLEAQFSTGAGSNPQDIAVDGNTAYVVGIGVPAIEVYDLGKDPPILVDTISLAALQSDGNPDAQSIYFASDGKLYVTLELLDQNFAPTDNGLVAVVDPTSKAVTSMLTLNFKDPYGFLTATSDGKFLLVPTEDDFSGQTGCLERIEVGKNKVDDCVADNSALGGTVGGFSLDPNDKAWVAVTSFATGAETGQLVGVSQGGSIDPAISQTTEVATDVGACKNLLLYSDASTGVLHVYDTAANAEGATVTLSLPPGNQNDIVCMPL